MGVGLWVDDPSSIWMEADLIERGAFLEDVLPLDLDLDVCFESDFDRWFLENLE